MFFSWAAYSTKSVPKKFVVSEMKECDRLKKQRDEQGTNKERKKERKARVSKYQGSLQIKTLQLSS